MMKKQFIKLAFLLCVLFPAAMTGADIDVTQPPYNADNTGTNDATAAIQAAINDATAQGYDVYLPAGIYLISSPLTVANNLNDYQIMIRGYSRSAFSGTIIRATADMDNMLFHYGNKVRLRRIRFEGEKKAVTIIRSGNSSADGTSLPRLEILAVSGAIGKAITSADRMASDGVTTGVISYLSVEDCGAGIYWYGNTSKFLSTGAYSPLTVNNMEFYENGGAPDGSYHLYCFSIFEDVNILDTYVYSGNASNMCLAIIRSFNCVLDGGYIDGIKRGPTIGLKSRNFIIKNYTVKNCYAGISSDLREDDCIPSAIYGDGVVNHALGLNGHLGGIIENNEIDSCVRAWFCQGSDIKFINNTITNCPGGPQYTGSNTGVLRFNGSQRVIVGGGNYISGLNGKTVIFATYNVNEPDPSETSLVYLYESLENYENTNYYSSTGSQIVIDP